MILLYIALALTFGSTFSTGRLPPPFSTGTLPPHKTELIALNRELSEASDACARALASTLHTADPDKTVEKMQQVFGRALNNNIQQFRNVQQQLREHVRCRLSFGNNATLVDDLRPILDGILTTQTATVLSDCILDALRKLAIVNESLAAASPSPCQLDARLSQILSLVAFGNSSREALSECARATMLLSEALTNSIGLRLERRKLPRRSTR